MYQVLGAGMKVTFPELFAKNLVAIEYLLLALVITVSKHQQLKAR
jgi:hypothetical protein